MLQRPDGQVLSPWTPGSHVDLVLENDLTRQYSLCGDPLDLSRYEVAVLRSDSGRGGSRTIHDSLKVGDTVRIRGPRNNFALIEAPSYLFIAGGIGITPLLPMIVRVTEAGLPWRLVYGGRTRNAMAFASSLAESYPASVTIAPHDEMGLLDLEKELGECSADSVVYCCGPESLLSAVEAECQQRSIRLRTERFAPRELDHLPAASGFDVELARSGVTLHVTPDESILDVVENAGVSVDYSCLEGTCGTCETSVLGGHPDHRDSVLSLEDRKAGNVMMICVSRSMSSHLILDL